MRVLNTEHILPAKSLEEFKYSTVIIEIKSKKRAATV